MAVSWMAYHHCARGLSNPRTNHFTFPNERAIRSVSSVDPESSTTTRGAHASEASVVLMLLSSLKVKTTGVTVMPEPSSGWHICRHQETFLGQASDKPPATVPQPSPETTPPPTAAHF